MIKCIYVLKITVQLKYRRCNEENKIMLYVVLKSIGLHVLHFFVKEKKSFFENKLTSTPQKQHLLDDSRSPVTAS